MLVVPADYRNCALAVFKEKIVQNNFGESATSKPVLASFVDSAISLLFANSPLTQLLLFFSSSFLITSCCSSSLLQSSTFNLPSSLLEQLQLQRSLGSGFYSSRSQRIIFEKARYVSETLFIFAHKICAPSTNQYILWLLLFATSELFPEHIRLTWF